MKSAIKKLGIGAGGIVGTFVVLWLMVAAVSLANAAPQPKYFVCKYVGTPGQNETLQTGQNPISVNGNALTPPIQVGGYFNDKQGRSLVVAEDTGQPEPSCPGVQTPPVVDVCVNLQGNQATVPDGTWLNDKGACVEITKCTGNTYEIGKDQHGNSICKENPTGCPYAENIPVDSPKCVAPTSDPVPTDPVTGEVFYGK